MAINIEYLESKSLFPYDYFVIQLLAQNTEGVLANYIKLYMNDDLLERLLVLDLITRVKKKNKSQTDYDVLRLSKKGRIVYRNAQIVDYSIKDELLLQWLQKLYDEVEKPIGNEERVKQLLAWFRVETSYLRRDIYKAIKTYVTYQVDKSNGKYIPSLENLLWKGASVFASKWTLADSKLYQFIREHNLMKYGDTES